MAGRSRQVFGLLALILLSLLAFAGFGSLVVAAFAVHWSSASRSSVPRGFIPTRTFERNVPVASWFQRFVLVASWFQRFVFLLLAATVVGIIVFPLSSAFQDSSVMVQKDLSTPFLIRV